MTLFSGRVVHEKEYELRRLINALRKVGKDRDYPVVHREAEFLFRCVYSWPDRPTVQQKGIVEHLEQLPGLLNGLKDRVRREHKKEAYERLIATMDELDISTLTEVWRNWNRIKEVIYSLAKDFILLDGLVRSFAAEIDPRLAYAVGESETVVRFEAKLLEILPKPRISPDDYDALLQEFEVALLEWRAAAIAPKNRERVDSRIQDAEARITELYALYLLDS